MTIALIIYIISIIIIMMMAILIKEEEDLTVFAIIPILNTLLIIIFIGYAITQAMKDYKQHKIKKKIEQNKQIPLYEFLNSKM